MGQDEELTLVGDLRAAIARETGLGFGRVCKMRQVSF